MENAETNEEARDAIKKAGMLLSDDELAQVSGGNNNSDNLLNLFNSIGKINFRDNSCAFCGSEAIKFIGYDYTGRMATFRCQSGHEFSIYLLQ
ncbi:MAG: hypothetical protein K5668_11250 [Lachnospiraceae bacterium]|nr:hypothetical protein [Lachnospiraceae bacterium]